MTAPTRIGRYEVIRELGRGAMGTVFLARDSALGRLVALKTFRTAHHEEPDLEDSGALRRRSLREAQRAGTLSHPNVITIYDFVEGSAEDDTFYIVMEYVEGQGLDARMRAEGAMKLADAAPLVSQIASALDHLHARGIVHRDVKPGNVLVTAEGRVKITDFGIARSEDPSHTLDTEVYGTPYYMAPEQIQGHPVDGRTDVFALGVVLYEMLTGARPFPGATVAEVAHRIVYGAPLEPEVNGQPLPAALREVLQQAIAKDPGDRFASAGALAAAVRGLAESTGDLDLAATTAFPRSRWLAPPPPGQQLPLPRTPWVIAAVTAVVLLLLTSGVLYLRSQRGPGAAPIDSELQARQVGYVKLVTEAKRLLAAGDAQGAALLFQTAEGLAIDPAGARRLRDDAQRLAEEQGAQLQLLDARQDLASGRYDLVVATARQMMETRAGREKAAGVLAEVQEALARGERAPRPSTRAPPRPAPQVGAVPPLPLALPTAVVNFGVLHIELESRSPEGVLTVWIDNREVARQRFEFYERTGFFRKRPVPGSWATDLTLSPGNHHLRVLVARTREPAQLTELDAPIAAGELRSLMIALPAAGAPHVELR